MSYRAPTFTARVPPTLTRWQRALVRVLPAYALARHRWYRRHRGGRWEPQGETWAPRGATLCPPEHAPRVVDWFHAESVEPERHVYRCRCEVWS